MITDNARYDENTGLPKDKSYLERGLPPYLEKSIKAMCASWEIIDNGGEDLRWDCWWGELNADISCAEVDLDISREQADYLRKKYLRMENNE